MNRRTFFISTFVAVLVLAVLACGVSPTVTQTPPPATQVPPPATLALTQPPTTSGELTIVSTFAFTDEWGEYHVVGELQNGTDRVLTSIELTIEIKDASGNSLLKDDNSNVVPTLTFQPLLYTLTPGEASPFEYYLSADAGQPATYNVTITGQQTGQADRANLTVENTQLVDDGQGTLYLTGELVNQGSQWAHINTLAGAALDNKDAVVSTDWTSTYTTELAPTGDQAGRDRTPFVISFPSPSGVEAAQWVTYVDADVIDAPTEYPIQIELSNTYFDSWGDFHIVALLTNTGSDNLKTIVVAGLYADDNTVLDADWSFAPIVLSPGESVPVDISSFSSVNYSDTQAGRVSTFTVQTDPYSTYPSLYDVVVLSTKNDQVQKNSDSWTITGDVTNTSSQKLSSETVIVAIYDGQGNLVATEYDYVYPAGDNIASNETNSYEVTIYLDPDVDAMDFTFQTIIQGDVTQ
jgi:hypothetical protein